MRISRLRALTLAGLLGLGAAGAASAAKAAQFVASSGDLAGRRTLAKVDQRRLAATVAAWHALEDRRDQGQPAFEKEIRRIESEFIFLLDQAPDDPTITGEAGRFFSGGLWYSRAPSSPLLDLVQRSPDPARLADRIAQPGTSRASTEILFAALAVRPQPAVLWQRAAQLIYDPPWRIALLEEACRRIATGETGRPVDTAAATALADELLEAELTAGLFSQALATFQSLTPAVRSRIEQGSDGQVRAVVDGLPFEGRSRDLRLPLVAAYLLAGDPQAADRLLAKIEPAPAVAVAKDSEARVGELRRQVFARWLHPSPEDPFDLLTTSLTSEPLGIGMLALARLAERENYPAIAAYCLDQLARARPELPFEPVRGVPARVQAAVDSTRGEIEQLRQSLADEARADREAARIASGPDPVAPTLSRLLRAPAAIRFAEKPLPDGIAPVEVPADQLEKRRKAMAEGVELPPDFGLVRLERQGDRAVALGVSQDYDPVGEVSPGAYWVLLSSDGGQTWGPPLYTGLRVNQPYVVRTVSLLPLLAEDHLQVEVEIAELDPSRIIFPPIALAPKRTAKGLYLDIPLNLLQKDSDGDGLTDLAEERLMTDPLSRDTDGDGLEDGVDPLPTVPFRRDAAPDSARALAAFLADTWNVDRAAIIEGIPEGPRVLCCARSGAQTVNEKTLFLIADRGLFSALSPTRRVVVLTPEEAEAAEKKFGPFYPQRLQLFVFDHSGRRAYVVWSATWQGGQTLLEERRDGTWRAMPKMNWIT
jgi:hypothetical protein